MNVSEKEFYKIVCKKVCENIDPLSLVYEKEVPVFEKYDEFVPDELVKKGFAYGVLDIDGMKNRVREVFVKMLHSISIKYIIVLNKEHMEE